MGSLLVLLYPVLQDSCNPNAKSLSVILYLSGESSNVNEHADLRVAGLPDSLSLVTITHTRLHMQLIGLFPNDLAQALRF
jgi:hypothetical protein